MLRYVRGRWWCRPSGVILGIGIILWACGALLAEDQTATQSRTTRMHPKARPRSTASSDEARLMSKLEKALANEQAILQKFDAVQEELRIIKVRASSRGAITQ